MTIAIIGLGYVGLPLALQFARSDVTVLGLDIDQSKVDRLNRGESYINHIAATDIAAAIAQGRFSASTDFSRIRDVEAVIICVPTPLGENREPDISYILNTGRAVAPYLGKAESGKQKVETRKPGNEQPPISASQHFSVSAFPKLVVLESTTYPGTTEEDLKNVLEEYSGAPTSDFLSASTGDYQRSGIDGRNSPSRRPDGPSAQEQASHWNKGEVSNRPISASQHFSVSASPRRLVAGIDFHLAFSPEREDPGNPNSKVAEIPKIVGGYTPACLERAQALYSRAIKTVIPVSSCRVAEATKLLENIFRSVNIALVNELKLVYAAMGIDIWEVINAAKTKPFGFMPFYPGPGLGGHCIPIDPFYLSWKARQAGKETRFIELAGEINTAMPQHVVSRVAEALHARQDTLSASSGERAGVRCRDHTGSSSAVPTSDLRPPTSDLRPPPSGPLPSGPLPSGPLSSGPLSSGPNEPLSGSKVLILGLAYKPNVDDDRESPTYVLMDLLKARGAEVAYYDPFVPVIRPSREHSHWAGTRSVSWNQKTISSFDAVLISTAHADVNYRQLAEWSSCIIDTRNIMAAIPTKPGQVWKA